MPSLLLIDNYDSFTYNLYHFLGELGAQSHVVRNDSLSATDALAYGADGIVLSPGPCDPDKAGICLELIEAIKTNPIPLLGVCLGHQCLGQAFGGRVIRANQVMHGKVSSIHHRSMGLFADLPSPLTATRYHSLLVERASLPDDLIITAETDGGAIMGLQHKHLPLHGVQFHPESIASEHGHALLQNFLNLINPRHQQAA